MAGFKNRISNIGKKVNKEAEKRVYYLTGKADIDISDITKKVKDVKSFNALAKFYMIQKKKEVSDYPFMIIDDIGENKSILYVGADKSYWDAERYGKILRIA